MDILSKITESVRSRVERTKNVKPLEEVREKALALQKDDFAFERALSTPGMSFICEVKKASPSKGVISSDFPYLNIALEYEREGTSAISVLTETDFFLGNDVYLQEIAHAVSVPTLRKDFTLDEYQIYEAKLLGASAVLLICALLNEKELTYYLSVAHAIGLSVLVEAHTEDEVLRAVNVGARIIGANNRNLKNFSIDFSTSTRLRKLVPPNILFVAESGIHTRGDVLSLQDVGVDAVLVGEALMRVKNKSEYLRELRGM